MKKPIITAEHTAELLDTRFVKVFDLQYAPGKHYIDATRREKENLIALKSDAEFKTMLADAVTCIVIVNEPGKEARLLLSYEYRYPTGRFLLSPPAGLIDPEDREREDALLIAAKREIAEETGIVISEKQRIFAVNPLVFSTPGLTDECNALVCAVLDSLEEKSLTTAGAVGTECFNGFELVTKQKAKKLICDGRDKHGNFYSLYTWAALMYFLSDMWMA